MPAPKPFNKAVLGPNAPPQPVLPQTPARRTPAPQVPQQLAQQHVPPVTQPIYIPRRDNGNGYARNSFSRWKGAVLTIAVLLVILVSAGGFFIIRNNQIVTDNANATATTIAYATANTIEANPYPSYLSGNGTLALYDPLRDNSQGYDWEWDQATDSHGGICQFIGEAYRVSMPDSTSGELCPSFNTNFSNFAFEVQMTIIKGDTGGLMFRAAPPNGNFEEDYYLFQIGQDGYYGLNVCSPHTCTALINFTDNSYINTGLNQTNLIAVVANGSDISLYVNQQPLSTVTDSTYSQGQLGFAAIPYYQGNPTDVLYSNARVWTLD